MHSLPRHWNSAYGSPAYMIAEPFLGIYTSFYRTDLTIHQHFCITDFVAALILDHDNTIRMLNDMHWVGYWTTHRADLDHWIVVVLRGQLQIKAGKIETLRRFVSQQAQVEGDGEWREQWRWALRWVEENAQAVGQVLGRISGQR